jgi:hypothetical protein
MTDPPRTPERPGDVGVAAQDSPPDLNLLLAREQGAIMRAEATGEIGVRDEQRALARRARLLIDSTPFPFRKPHDFDAITPAQQRLMDFPEFDDLKRRVNEMDRALADDFAEGRVGTRWNSFQHRSRVIRQGRQKLEHMHLCPVADEQSDPVAKSWVVSGWRSVRTAPPQR